LKDAEGYEVAGWVAGTLIVFEIELSTPCWAAACI
jgi:hypothetical protein